MGCREARSGVPFSVDSDAKRRLTIHPDQALTRRVSLIASKSLQCIRIRIELGDDGVVGRHSHSHSHVHQMGIILTRRSCFDTHPFRVTSQIFINNVTRVDPNSNS